MTFLFVGPELNGCQKTIHSTQKATAGAIKFMSYLSSTLTRDINFSPVGNMTYTKLMDRSSKRGKDNAVGKNKRRASIFSNLCACCNY